MPMPETDFMFSDGEDWEDALSPWLTAAASGILVGTNPAYAVSDFLAFYPQFGSLDSNGNYTGPVAGGNAIITAYIALASASLSQARWQDAWTIGMALYVAHFLTLYLQTQAAGVGSTAQQVASAGFAKGIQVAKSVGDVSVSYQSLSAFEDWGAWNITLFGQQLMTMAQVLGSMPLYLS